MRLTEESEFGFIKEEPLKYAPTKPIFTKDDDSLWAVCDILNKLGQLEDLMEKYGFETVEDLDNFIQSCINRVKYESKKEKV